MIRTADRILTRKRWLSMTLGSIKHNGLRHWINKQILLLEPQKVVVCSGDQNEYNNLMLEMERNGTVYRVSKRINSWLFRSDANDVARVENCTYVCSKQKQDAGLNNNWEDPNRMRDILTPLLSGAMKGRTMYIVPFIMGQPGSSFSKIGVQITDSAYAVVNMRLMTTMGNKALNQLGSDGIFIPCTHTVGQPLAVGQKSSVWPCNKTKYIVHFPEDHEIISFGSGYGGNSLLGKKCLALRIASILGRDEGWLAEHMLILGLTNPYGHKKYIAAAFPSACGKTNLAMLRSTLPGWKVETIGDDIAWLRIGTDGRLYAINPEAGFFGVAPGTSRLNNPVAIETIDRDTIFTNVALTENNDVWWEGLTEQPPKNLIDWKGKKWSLNCSYTAAHANSRFTTPITNCPVLDSGYFILEGVPISAILFGGRRESVVPLVYEGFNWQHGILMGASISSQQTAAAEGKIGILRHDPFAMLPFCGYNMGNYFSHWLNIEKLSSNPINLPKFFSVNWFLQGTDGSFLWPGFGDNIRVLKWIFERCDNNIKAIETPIGLVPDINSLDTNGLNLNIGIKQQLLFVDRQLWKEEIIKLDKYFSIFGETFPAELRNQLNQLSNRLNS